MGVSARVDLMTKAMLTKEGLAIKGNHAVVRTADRVAFYYRGTPIVEWIFETGEVLDVESPFEGTAATRANRKKARAAIQAYQQMTEKNATFGTSYGRIVGTDFADTKKDTTVIADYSQFELRVLASILESKEGEPK